MTLQEFFNLISDHPFWILGYFAIIPLLAFIFGWIGKGEGHLKPWKQIYSILIYLVSVPGIFAITLSVYLFLFEHQSVMQTNLYTQILPVISMFVTLSIIRKNVPFDYIPGFDKISGLIMMITATLMIMWFVDRTRIWVVSFLPFQYVLLIFVALFLIIRLGWSRISKAA